MIDRSHHRRVLHFAVTGVLLGAGCTGNEPVKGEAKPELEKKDEAKPEVPKKPEPEVQEFAPNPGPNERVPPEVAPTTAVKEPPPIEPIEEPMVNEGPIEPPEAEPEKRVNTGPVRAPEPTPPIKVNPGPEG